jgi:hypothetical protein
MKVMMIMANPSRHVLVDQLDGDQRLMIAPKKPKLMSFLVPWPRSEPVELLGLIFRAADGEKRPPRLADRAIRKRRTGRNREQNMAAM